MFDLDRTLWPFWIDSYVTMPLKVRDHPWNGSKQVFDASNKEIKSFPESTAILHNLYEEGFRLAFASRTTCIEEAKHLVELFGWEKYVSFMEIYPGSKVQHFQNFHRYSGIPFSQMLFFDDEKRNVRDVSRLGVVCMHTPRGISTPVLHQGFREYRNQHFYYNPVPPPAFNAYGPTTSLYGPTYNTYRAGPLPAYNAYGALPPTPYSSYGAVAPPANSAHAGNFYDDDWF